MGLAILSNGTFPSDCPSFGEIVGADALQHAARISSANNNIDLSDNEYLHTNIGTVTYTSEGVSNGTGNGYIQTPIDNKAANSFTTYATFKLALNGETTYNTWVSGSYVDAITKGGWGLYIKSEADPANAGKFRIIARASMPRRRASDGAFGYASMDIVLIDNLTSLPATTSWFVLAMGFDLATRTFRVRNVITGTVVSRATTDAEWVLQSYDGAIRNAEPSSVPNYRLMSAANSSLDNLNTIVLGEAFYWDRLLTDAEFTEQLAYSRSFMLNARGVTLP